MGRVGLRNGQTWGLVKDSELPTTVADWVLSGKSNDIHICDSIPRASLVSGNPFRLCDSGNGCDLARG